MWSRRRREKRKKTPFILKPYDSPFWEKSNPGRKRERKKERKKRKTPLIVDTTFCDSARTRTSCRVTADGNYIKLQLQKILLFDKQSPAEPW